MSTIGKLSEEQKEALKNRDLRLLELEDEETHEKFVLLPRSDFQSLFDEKLLSELKVAFEQADKGELETWNGDEFLNRMHTESKNDPCGNS
ncbi:MAG: hypothetical protein KDA65_12430 [Planctomycetaceae bacterium]|nr:hypothetical protein [Planctomycetaceae bacterium]